MHGTIEPNILVELKSLDELTSFAADLRDLAERALEPNVFYEPAFVAAAAPVFGRSVVAGLVWRRGTPARLIGFFPIRIERRRYGVPLPVAVGWTHAYGPLGGPLVDRECREAAIDAWLDHLASDPALPKLLLMPYLPPRSTAAFEAALEQRGGRCAEFGYHVRAMLRPDQGRAGYLDVAVPHKKRKELRRQRKRLAEQGALRFDTATAPPALDTALEDFFVVEAAGWKGRAGTAARMHEDVRRFVMAAVSGLAAEGKASVARLSIDDCAVAAIVTLRSGDAAWCWKIAYDEAFARVSPGVQLLLDVTETLLKDTSVARADSCATADHPMIDHIWRERLALADRLMWFGPGGSFPFATACALEAARRAAITSAKRLRNLMRP
jgi:hypothetical protein